MNETRILADWVSGLKIEDIPDEVVEHAERFLLDNLGCQLAGATTPWSRQFYDVVKKTRSGGSGAATVSFYGDRLSPDDAAFLNATFNHANECDDTHLKSPTHPGQIAVPSAMAMAEYAGCDGDRLLLAVIAAYEVMIRISWSCAPYLIYRGHHPPVGVGPFGAATAGAIILGFDKQTALDCYGIAGSHSAGLIEYTKTGGSVKRIHAGIPTQGGVRATLFAEAGITGPASILEGEKGFCKVFAGDYDLTRLTDELGTRWHMLDNGLKPYACCHLIHFVFDAIDELRDQKDFGPDDLDELIVYTNSEPILSHIGSITEPTDILGAQFSLPFSTAMRIHHGGRGMEGGNGFWDYLEVDVKNQALIETANKIKVMVAADRERYLTVDTGAGVVVKLKDGTEMESKLAHSWGLPENPLSDADLAAKFHYLNDPILPQGRAQQIIDTVGDVRSLKSVDGLVELLVVGGGQPERTAAE
ncbi:MAG: hypothetical protein CMM48_13080 [Rhodospirillaceae bacterium]|nr:hypothetical protein [Rhodospirillaceae bacterium]